MSIIMFAPFIIIALAVLLGVVGLLITAGLLMSSSDSAPKQDVEAAPDADPTGGSAAGRQGYGMLFAAIVIGVLTIYFVFRLVWEAVHFGAGGL
jgi:hypothetical protein